MNPFAKIRRTPVKRSPKARAKARQVAVLDGLVRQLVFARDKCCVRCGGTTALTPFHILPKGTYPRMRFELLNVICACWPCHRHHWHDNPIDGLEWLERKLPGRIDTLRVLAAVAPKLDLKLLQIALQREVEQLP